MSEEQVAVVFDVEHFATKEGPGIRTAVFLKGCPLRCMWCHNPESWNPKIEKYPDGTVIGRERTVGDVLEEVARDKAFYDASGGGLTVSGGEPLFRWQFARELFARAKTSGISTAIETSGYAAELHVRELMPLTDLWLFDIKGMDSVKHKEHVGIDNAAIHRNLRMLDANGAKIILRCPMIPDVNDFPENLSALARLADELKNVEAINVEPYIAYGIDKAHKLGLKVYEAPSAPPEYGKGIVNRLKSLTRKSVVLS